MRRYCPPPLLLAVALAPGLAAAGSDLNEVGALLVFPVVIALEDPASVWETLLAVTNASPVAVVAHVSYIDGDDTGASACGECDFDIPLTPNDTELLVLTRTPYGVSIEAEDGTVSLACPQPYGMVVVTLQDTAGRTISSNVLLGSAVIVSYTNGSAYSVPAIPFQGRSANDGDRHLRFDDAEYGRFPRIVAADFIAPDLAGAGIGAELVLFTLGFRRGLPPLTDCTVTGYDAAENPFSRSLLFGCWTALPLCDVHPEFCYPNLGQLPGQLDTHGWLKLSCRVDRERNGSFDANGAVHGVLIQTMAEGAIVRRGTPGARPITGSAAWAQLLYQSVTTGGSIALELAEHAGGLD